MVRVRRSREEVIDDAVKRQQERRRRASAATQGLRKQRLSERKRMHGEDNGDGISQGRKEVIQIDLPAERRGGLSSSECPDLVFEFFKFLMYMRGQLPDTYDNLVESEKHDAAAAIPSITRTKKRQKRSNFDLLHEKVEGTFASLVQAGVMASGCSCEVVFVFGAAARRPREAYLIRIHTRPEKTLNGPPPFEVKRGLSQKLNRAVVMHLTNSNLKDLPRTCKVHILFRSSGIPRHSEPKGFFHNPGFDFRRLKVNPVEVELVDCKASPSSNHAPQQQQEQQQPIGVPRPLDAECLWYQCSIQLKGVN